VTIKGSTLDHRSEAAYTPWVSYKERNGLSSEANCGLKPNGDFHADTSFEINRK
jgi:hypothetical protein